MLDDKDDGLNAARGLFWGTIFSIICWGVVYCIWKYFI